MYCSSVSHQVNTGACMTKDKMLFSQGNVIVYCVDDVQQCNGLITKVWQPIVQCLERGHV